VVDNLSNSRLEVLDQICWLVYGRKFSGETEKDLKFYCVDVTNSAALEDVFQNHLNQIWAVIHLAGLKSAPLSVEKPLLFYSVNVVGAINLFACMERHGVHNCIFSSSASVYASQKEKIPETSETKPENPYGDTKLIVEQLLQNLSQHNGWSTVLLRYFNPMGCEESGHLGENPVTHQSNLQTIMAQVACGQRKILQVFGDQFDTPDGTAVRDYIHVEDLARGHINALSFLGEKGYKIFNLGLGRGHSVLDVVHEWEKLLGRKLNCEIVKARPGDPAHLVADITLAKVELNWEPTRGLTQMVQDYWRFWNNLNQNGSREKSP